MVVATSVNPIDRKFRSGEVPRLLSWWLKVCMTAWPAQERGDRTSNSVWQVYRKHTKAKEPLPVFSPLHSRCQRCLVHQYQLLGLTHTSECPVERKL